MFICFDYKISNILLANKEMKSVIFKKNYVTSHLSYSIMLQEIKNAKVLEKDKSLEDIKWKKYVKKWL